MSTPHDERAHAHLGPSAASRWLACPGSVALGDGYTETSDYADEGTAAHEYVETEARALLIGPKRTARHTQWAKAHGAKFDATGLAELRQAADDYVAALKGYRDAIDGPSAVLLEQRVQTGIPGCWGTADAIVVGAESMAVVDFKYGVGQWVSPVGNPQLMLYAVGALETYGDLLGDAQRVTMAIHQPRAGGLAEVTMDAAELRAWRDSIAPQAAKALAGSDEFHPSVEACQFCPAAGNCAAQAEAALAVPMPADADAPTTPAVLDGSDLARALEVAPLLRQWLTDVDHAARVRLQSGEVVPGWKLVRSNGRAKVTDAAHAVQRLVDAGYPADEVAEFRLRPFGHLDKLVGGRDVLADVLGDVLTKTEGGLAVAPESDKREAVDSTAQLMADFDDFDGIG